jgi:SAM-dependent methyltransferase
VGQFTVLELGCGAGNTVFPLLTTLPDPRLFVYACDFSATAVDLVRVRHRHSPLHTRTRAQRERERETNAHTSIHTRTCIHTHTPAQLEASHAEWVRADMKERRAGATQASPYYDAARCHAFVCDVAATALDPPVPPATVDVAVLIFVLSAMRPAAMPAVLARIYTALRPGGLLLFRDYGRYDLAQLRFRDRHVLDTNFYARGDGTRVYFFTEGMRPTPASLSAPASVRTCVCRVVPRCM